MEKMHEKCKQACSYVFIQENYIKAHVLMYLLQLVLTFTPPPLHHNGKGSIIIADGYVEYKHVTSTGSKYRWGMILAQACKYR